MVRQVPFRLALLVPVVLLVVMPSVSAHGDEEWAPPEPDVLWLGVQSVVWADWTNFTTRLPEGEGYVQAPEAYVERATWTWFTASMPERWVVFAGTELRLVVVVSGMEQTWPLPLPSGNETMPFAASFEGEAARRGLGGTTIFASGETVVPMDPVHPPEGPVRVEIPMVVDETVVVEPGDRFDVALHVYARGVKHNSMRLHTGGAETASYAVVPGFPVAGFRAWEEAFPHDVCLWHRSEGETCPEARLEGPTDRGGAGPGSAEEAPAAVPWLVVMGIAWSLHRRRFVAP